MMMIYQLSLSWFIAGLKFVPNTRVVLFYPVKRYEPIVIIRALKRSRAVVRDSGSNNPISCSMSYTESTRNRNYNNYTAVVACDHYINDAVKCSLKNI